MCGGGGALVAGKWEPCRFQHQYFTVWDTSVSAERVTLFSKGSGTGHHGGGYHSYIVGVWGHLVGGMGSGVISVSSEPKPGDILDTAGGGFILSYFRIIW